MQEFWIYDKIKLYNMKRVSKTLLLIAFLLLSMTTWAQTALEVGCVYHFQNAHFTSRAITAVESNNTSVQATATNPKDLKQLWFVSKDSDGYIFRNMSNGYYLSQTAQNSWGLTETCTANSNKFEYIDAGGTNNTIRSASVSTNTNGYMHLGSVGQTNIQGWGSGSGGTQWTVSKFEYTDEHDEILGQFAENSSVEVVGAALGAIFSDEACSKLEDEYASMSNEQLYADANYQALPTALRKMVKKVRSNNWAELTIAPADRPNGNNNTNHELWTVEDTWDSDYAKRFRVQMYEPYSIEGEVTSYLRLNAHCNMDNPTGIYANSGDVIYIMVDGDIADGAELWLAHQKGNGATNYYTNEDYTQLHEGLNRVTFTSDGCQMWINYLVHTYNEDGVTIAEKFPENRKLSNYKPLKIHIEGGHINGFFNAIGDFRAADSDTEDLWGDVDNDNDWNYYKARVALPTDFALLGHRQTLLFPFGSYDSEKGNFGVANADGGIEYALAYHLENIKVVSTPNCYGGSGTGFGNYSDTYYPSMGLSTDNGKINIMLEAWDRIMYSELASMGLVSKSTMDKMNELYPRWTAEGTPAEIYNYDDSYLEFCQGIDYSEYFNHHGCGVGAGSGYMSGGWRVCNYNYNTMPSIIGLIANEAGPTWGPAHEIGHQHQAVFNLNGQTEVTNNFFSNVAVWYMGMGTSRVNGSEGSLASVLAAFNTDGNDLYTNNIWAITHLYYRLWLYYHLAGNNTQFWPRLFELCRQVPLVNGGQISGETSLLRFYQHACDAAGEDLTEFFRAHGFFEIMDNRLVGDYSNATYNITQEQIDAAIKEVKDKGYPQNLAVLFINDGTAETTLRHDGTTKRSLWDNNPTAEFGSVNDFIDGDVDITTAYTATLGSDGNVTMSGGEGGVGFLILNENGEIISFSNKSTFELSEEALHALVSGKAEIVAVDDKSETKEAEVDLTVIKRDILAMLINDAKAITDKVDNTYTRVGFYKAASVSGLVEAIQLAEAVCENGTGYEAAYEILYAEYQKVLADRDAKIPFDSNLTYIITNAHYAGNVMYVNTDGETPVVCYSASVGTEGDTAHWQFKETSTGGVYNIYNMGEYYCAEVANDAQLTTTSEPSSTAVYRLQEISDGVWAIRRDPLDNGRNIHAQGATGQVIGWGVDSPASGWYLTAVEANSSIADLAELQALMTNTKSLVDEVATISYTKGEAIDLQTTQPSGNYYLSCNAPSSAEGSIDNLVDGATSNYFHTDFTSEPLSGSHYLTVNFGNADGLERFLLSYTTRSGASADFPKGIDVYGSHDGNSYRLIGTVEKLPQSAGTYWEATDAMISAPYKYLRFNVHANRGYWHMAEFDIYSVASFESTLRDYYKDKITDTKVDAAHEAYMSARSLVDTASPSSEEIKAVKSTLQQAYGALLTEYNVILETRKETLSALAAETEALMPTVGTIELLKVSSMKLTTENLYCNAPYTAQNNNDYSAAYVDKLTDGKVETFMHTDYSGTVATPHYLRVDLGENSTVKNFKFNYMTRDNGNNCPTTIVVEGCNEADGEYVAIRTLTRAADGLPNPEFSSDGGMAESFESGVISSPVAYRYIRFKVTGVEGGGSATYFVISEFGFSKVTDNVAINDAYSEIVTEDMLLSIYFVKEASKTMSEADNKGLSVDMLDAQIAEMQETKTNLENLIALVGVDKEALQTLYNDDLALYDKMADDDGNVDDDYRPSALTNEKLAEVKAAIDDAKDKLDNSTQQAEVDAAKDALQTLYDALLAVEEANVATTIDKSELNTAITNANALIEAIVAKGDDYYASVTGLGIAELSFALQQAENVVERFYLTEEQYTTALSLLNDCYNETQGIVNADYSGDRTALSTLIAEIREGLMEEITEETAGKCAISLQASDVNAPFYVRLSGVGSGNVADILDKNDDGSANIETYVGSSWGGTIADYTHFVEVDMGIAIAIDELQFDYATRNSGHETERPTAIKVLGSNNGTNFTEITVIDSGLATGAGEQWAMENPLDLGGLYRYIRFAVKSGVNSFHMSDFNLYVLADRTLSSYYANAGGIDYIALYLALQSAEYVVGHYTVNEKYNAVYDMLNSCYTAVQTVVDADWSNRDGLEALIAETETLIASLANVTDVNTPVLSADNVYCNADNSTNSSAGEGDKLGVEALFDGKTDTHLHTTYGNNVQNDDLDHYIRIDMGEGNAVKAFKFNYVGRNSNSNNDPATIVVQACNTIDGEWVNVRTLTGLPTDGDAVKYTSPLIDMEEAYRYVRLMVTDTQNHSTTTYNDVSHKFFVLSEFGFETYPTVVIGNEYAFNLYSEPIIEAYIEKNVAIEENGRYMLESEYNEVVANLQAAKTSLENSLLLNEIPVKLTRNAEKPVLYKIRIKRSATSVLQYDEASGMVAVADDELNRNQAWYFMSGTNDEVFDDILIMPYSNNGAQNTTLKLGSNDLNDGNSKVKGVDGGDDSYKINWYITFKTNVVTDEAGNETITDVTKTGFWNIQPEGKGTYFSNHGGASHKMGFWSSDNSPSDDGSNFQFILDETDYSLSDAYFALYNEHVDCGGLKVGGVNIGQYSESSVAPYNEAYNNATALLDNKTAEDSEYDTMRETLSNAYNSLDRKMPNEKGLYRIKSANTNAYSNGKFAYVNSDNKPHFANPENECLAEYIWQFEVNDNGYYIKSLQTQCYLDTAKWATQINLSARPLKYTVEILDEVTGELKLNSTGGYPLHAQDSGSKLVGYTGGLGSASAWYIEELSEAEIELIHYPYTMSALGYGTLMLGFNAIIPENITASYAEGLDGTSIKMVAIENVLPANTPVILKSNETLAEALPLEFVYTTETAAAIENNMLEGTLCKGVVEAGAERDIYMMQAKNNVVKMYWMYENYDANGERVQVNGSYNHDKGGYVMNSANRAYLVINREVAQQVANYALHFGAEGTTAVEDVDCENGNVEAIYDLQGRKLEGITQPGFYIVNGKKVYVK